MYNVVLAYMPSVGSAEWNPYEYGETMLPKGIEVVHPRYAISWRNKWMVNESDIVVCYINRSWGGAATEATKAMMKFANEHFAVIKFSSSHVEQNKASGHVMEKCGLHFTNYGQFQKLDGSNKMRSMEYEGIINNF